MWWVTFLVVGLGAVALAVILVGGFLVATWGIAPETRECPRCPDPPATP